MMWLIPRSDPGALTEYRRPHVGAVSTAQDPPEHHDPAFSIEIEATEAQALFDQAHRLFACRFTTREQTMPVIGPSFVRRPDDTLRLPQVAWGRGWALAHSEAFRHALAERRFEPNLAIVRTLRRRPFALDVYLWDAGYGDYAPLRRSRLARYHALADQPLRAPGVSDVLAFERQLARARNKLWHLQRELDPHD